MDVVHLSLVHLFRVRVTVLGSVSAHPTPEQIGPDYLDLSVLRFSYFVQDIEDMTGTVFYMEDDPNRKLKILSIFSLNFIVL